MCGYIRANEGGLEGGLGSYATTTLKAWAYPNGCHVAEVEIDEETGVVRLTRYTVADDFGKVINPRLFHRSWRRSCG